MMKNESQKYIQGTIAIHSDGLGVATNSPSEYQSRQKQYLDGRTRKFAQERAYLSSDYVSANVQGLGSDFYDWTSTNIRLADVSTTNITTFDVRRKDDFKEVLFPDESITYIPIGAKVETMGSTWISINPSNISNPNATTVIARCNATYNFYDYYGNVVKEPIVVERANMLSNRPESPLNLVLMNGYFNIICQLNENTKRLGENGRLILGQKAYYVTGYTDFIQEFTGDEESVHLVTFTVRVEEPTEQDDLALRIADGNRYSFSTSLQGAEEIKVGSSETLTPSFIQNGEEVFGNTENPVSWIWESSDSTIVSVDENGVATAHNVGNATIRAILSQNNDVYAEIGISAYEGTNEPYVSFLGFIPNVLAQYSSETIRAAYFENGVETGNVLSWNFSGADPNSYYVSLSVDGKSATIECINPSKTPLTVTVSYGEVIQSVSFDLEGY